MNLRILAVGQDIYWLTAIQHATAKLMEAPPGRKRKKDSVKCISDLPRPRPNTVLLLDASDQRDVVEAVTGLRSKGWKYVVVVAADQSVRQATAVLRQGLGYDYWIKTYDEEQIRQQIMTCFEEIAEEKKTKDES
jgi:thiaminase